MLLRFPRVPAAAPCQPPAVNGPRDVAAADDNDTISSGGICPGRCMEAPAGRRVRGGRGAGPRPPCQSGQPAALEVDWPGHGFVGVTIYSETQTAACIGTEIPGRGDGSPCQCPGPGSRRSGCRARAVMRTGRRRTACHRAWLPAHGEAVPRARIRLVRLAGTVHIAEGGGQDVPAAPAEPECPGGGERGLWSAAKRFADLADDPPPHAAGKGH
jgi:hypothetical protein